MPSSPSCARNRGPILDVLRRHFAQARHVLEIGSGTGEHAAWFAPRLPHLSWQASDAEPQLEAIRGWRAEAASPNLPPPIALQAVADAGLQPPPSQRFDAVFSANTLHIMGWPEVQALFAGLPRLLVEDAVLAFYGPFNLDGRPTSDSNRAFDAWLRARDARSGIRDREAIDALARDIGFGRVEDVAMPANNRMLLYARDRT